LPSPRGVLAQELHVRIKVACKCELIQSLAGTTQRRDQDEFASMILKLNDWGEHVHVLNVQHYVVRIKLACKYE